MPLGSDRHFSPSARSRPRARRLAGAWLVVLAGAPGLAAVVAAPVPGWKLAVGPHVTCVREGTSQCVGEDSRQVPSDARWLDAAREISFGVRHGCALDGDGIAHCWGDGSQGQLGVGARPAPSGKAGAAQPAPVPNLPRLRSLDAGWLHTCGATREGVVYCWGADALDQLGRAAEGPAAREVSGLAAAARDLSSGGFHACAALEEGSVACWGDGSAGQLGQGAKVDASAPVAVVALGGPVVEVSAGAYHTCARRADGAVLCWGDNRFGQLGDGSRTGSARPVAVAGLAGPAVRVVSGFSFACALMANGDVRCWGSNELGELGSGRVGAQRADGSPPVAPRIVDGIGGPAAEIEADGNHACARRDDGAVLCWGSNAWGQLGDGSIATGGRPVRWLGKRGPSPRPTLAAPAPGPLRGLDVSYHSGHVDWAAAVARGDRFGLTLATAGVDFFDPYFFDHWEGMRRAGLVRGAYHFFVADDDPEAQARHFLAQVPFEPGDLLPVVDVESRKAPVPDLPARLHRFLAVVEAAIGVRPIIYTGPTFWQANMTAEFGDYPLWIAEYDVEEPQVPRGWKQWHLWQWRGDAALPEIAPVVDLNRVHPEVDLRSLRIPPGAGASSGDRGGP